MEMVRQENKDSIPSWGKPSEPSGDTSLTNHEQTKNFSWVKIVTQEPNDSGLGNSSKSDSSSPGINDSSGYSSLAASPVSEKTTIVEQDTQVTPQPVDFSWNFFEALLDVDNPNKPLPNETYTLFAPPGVQIANQKAHVYLQIVSNNHNSLPMLKLHGTAVHSSGLKLPMSLEKIESLPGYRCTFFPMLTGRYCIAVYSQDLIDPPHGEKVLGTPIELVISKNYMFDADSHNAFELVCGSMNGSKYWGITTDKYTNMLYATDRENHEVVALHPYGNQPLFKFGQNSLTPAGILYRPTGIVCDTVNRRLIICDKDNHRVVFITMDGHFISAFGKKGHQNGEFNYPWDVDISPSGDLIVVSDSRNHRIQMFDRFGNYLRKYSVFETHPFDYKQEFDYPRGITFDLEGKTIFVTDFNTHNVVALNLELTESRRLIPPGKLIRPQGITMDEFGNLLVCDSRRNCLRVITPTGDLIASIVQVGQLPLNVPSDVAVLRGGEAVVSDIFGRVRVF